ncbi:hypothetical protein B1813_06705 [Saccharomonospora piscinae]|uniref:Uncharacterized protein n=1 Tax=Saccharomonospora piscinae TaxID=687388 RepID=A0A1V9A4J8_SACPI|nr:hypothetical protein [Saccharomonospora piscinae]OQO91968.1 hypothetical protein B1813_06705 [Saccharomonospora piscinae]
MVSESRVLAAVAEREQWHRGKAAKLWNLVQHTHNVDAMSAAQWHDREATALGQIIAQAGGER